VAGWIVIGVILLVAMRLLGKEDWLHKAGQSVETAELGEERAHSPAV